MKYILTIVISGSTLLLGSCKFAKESKNWRNTIETEMTAMRRTFEGAVKAVPGERYLQLVDIMNDPNAKEEDVERAKGLIKNIFNLDPDQPNFAVRVGFKIDRPNELLSAYVFNNQSSDDTIIKSWCARLPNWPGVDFGNGLSKPVWSDERLTVSNEILRDALSDLSARPERIETRSGPLQFITKPGRPDAFGYNEQMTISREHYLNTKSYEDRLSVIDESTRRDSAADKIHEAMIKLLPHRSDYDRIQVDYKINPALDGMDVFVVIDKKDFERVYGDIKDDPQLRPSDNKYTVAQVEMFRVDKKGNPILDSKGQRIPFHTTSIRNFQLQNFRATLKCGEDKREVIYAVHHFGQNTGISEAYLSLNQSADELVAKYNEQKSERSGEAN